MIDFQAAIKFPLECIVYTYITLNSNRASFIYFFYFFGYLVFDGFVFFFLLPLVFVVIIVIVAPSYIHAWLKFQIQMRNERKEIFYSSLIWVGGIITTYTHSVNFSSLFFCLSSYTSYACRFFCLLHFEHVNEMLVKMESSIERWEIFNLVGLKFGFILTDCAFIDFIIHHNSPYMPIHCIMFLFIDLLNSTCRTFWLSWKQSLTIGYCSRIFIAWMW